MSVQRDMLPSGRYGPRAREVPSKISTRFLIVPPLGGS